jgi:hypothetical protein
MLEVAVFPTDRIPDLAFSSHHLAMNDWLRNGEESSVEKT